MGGAAAAIVVGVILTLYTSDQQRRQENRAERRQKAAEDEARKAEEAARLRNKADLAAEAEVDAPELGAESARKKKKKTGKQLLTLGKARRDISGTGVTTGEGTAPAPATAGIQL